MSIYDAIGGGPAVEKAVDDFYDRILADSQLSPYFDSRDVPRIKRHQRAFIAAALGGPQLYSGRSMRDGHAHLGITSTAFDRVVHHLVATLTHLGVPEDTIGEIGAKLAPLKSDIVTVHGRASLSDDQIVDIAKRSQEAVITAVRSWTDAVQSLAGEHPTLPDAHNLVDTYFDFAEKALSIQRDAAHQAVAASVKAAEALTEQATKSTAQA